MTTSGSDYIDSLLAAALTEKIPIPELNNIDYPNRNMTPHSPQSRQDLSHSHMPVSPITAEGTSLGLTGTFSDSGLNHENSAGSEEEFRQENSELQRLQRQKDELRELQRADRAIVQTRALHRYTNIIIL